MRVSELIANLPLRVVRGETTLDVTDLTDDSRQKDILGPHSVFVDRAGTTKNANRHIEDAVNHGTAAIISDRAPSPIPTSPNRSLPVWILADNVDQALAGTLAERLFDYPGRKLKLLGVTGTNGKTTTCLIIAHLLNHAAMPCGVIGTVAIDDGRQRRPAQLTTPGAIELSRILAAMVNNGCQAAAIEVSSHALHQGRTAALDFDAAIFTNLTGDHLDYHKNMNNYAATKSILFSQLDENAWAIINADDRYAKEITHNCSAHRLNCSLNSCPTQDHDCQADVIDLAGDRCRACFTGPWGSVELVIPMVGRHNISNTLQALACANAITPLSRNTCRSLQHMAPVPGRLEPVSLENIHAPTVLVDYAHTHDALINVLNALRPLTQGRLIVVFGCGGDRDKTKRPKMAAAACNLADHVIITSDNPRTEEPLAIIDDIRQGVPEGASVQIEPNRAKAIGAAIAQAEPQDTILLAGKGHEPYQEIGNTRHPFDDRTEAEQALRQRHFWTPQNLQQITNGHWYAPIEQQQPPLHGISIDSRSIRPAQVFVAVKGEHFDGHDFINQAADAGAAMAITSDKRPSSLPTLLVDDTVVALQQIAHAYRDVLKIAGTKVIAVTGSNGKTTTRHLIHAVLSGRYRGTQSPQNFNNHIGVPLTLLAASPGDSFVVVEIGTNHPGEVAQLGRIVQPNHVVITSIGQEHLAYFGSIENVAIEELSILSFVEPQGTAAIEEDALGLLESMADDPQCFMHDPVTKTRLTFGAYYNSLRELNIAGYGPGQSPRQLAVQWDQPQIETCLGGFGCRFQINGMPYEVPLLGQANAVNATAAIIVGQVMQLTAAQIALALKGVKPMPMRMQPIVLGRNAQDSDSLVLINDAYNANPSSTRIAIFELHRLTRSLGNRRTVVILGDMVELGGRSPQLHRELAHTPAAGGIQVWITIGSLAQHFADEIRPHPQVHAFTQWADTLPGEIAQLLHPGDVVLLKASRSMKLERLIPAIEKKMQ